MTGFIYAIGDRERVKIGYSRDPLLRAVKIRADSSHDVRLIGAVAGTKAHEREIHHLLSGYRLHGEWFRNCGAVAAFCGMLPTPVSVVPPRGRKHAFGKPLSEIGRKLGVGRAAVCKWSKGRVPAKWVVPLERVTGISRHELRPDVFGPAPSADSPTPQEAA